MIVFWNLLFKISNDIDPIFTNIKAVILNAILRKYNFFNVLVSFFEIFWIPLPLIVKGGKLTLNNVQAIKIFDDSEINKTLCRILKEERIKRKMSIEELSKKSSVSLSTIRRIESGIVEPRLSTFYRLIDILGLTNNKKFVKKLMRKKILH